jgi:hypothetical protein
MAAADRFVDDGGAGKAGAAENMNASHGVSLPGAKDP